MIEVVRSAEVAAPPDRVWGVLSDFGGISAWAANVDHSCLTTDLGEGVGTARRVQIGRLTLIERVTTWEPPSTLGYTIEGLPPVVRAVANTWHVHRTEAGSGLALVSRVEPGPRPPHQLAARVVTRMLARASEEMLTGLAARCVTPRAERRGPKVTV